MSLTSRDFPPGTPLHHFFAWNEAAPRWRRDRRYRLARKPGQVPEPVARALQTAIGNPDPAAHAAVFAAFEQAALRSGNAIPIARDWNLSGGRAPSLTLPRLRGREGWGHRVESQVIDVRKRILVIRLSALGDFIQALGPIAAIRRHHAGDHLTLLTTRPLAGFAEALGCFDAVMIDERPGILAPRGWLRLRDRLRRGRFDRVYDLQTSTRTASYAWLLRPGMPQWSGIAWRCSHPHANRGRDPQHTLDKQAEQLLMAGIYPTPLPTLPPLRRNLPPELQNRIFALLVPGSSPAHPEKRWPAKDFGALARALDAAGVRPVVIGTAPEAPLASRIRALCPAALDLTGKTDLALLGALAQHAALTIGNDTGVCHLAAASGCAVVVLFGGGTDPARCAPRGRRVEIIQAADLRDLGADAVIAAALAVLEPDSRVR